MLRDYMYDDSICQAEDRTMSSWVSIQTIAVPVADPGGEVRSLGVMLVCCDPVPPR
jgi:hypothetical protein